MHEADSLPRPGGPFRPDFWRSPLRGPWLTSILGAILLPLVAIVALSGLISHDAYQPAIGVNATVPQSADLPVLITLPSGAPSWLYAVTQGAHVTVGLIAVPVLLAKLWSVIPRLFVWPPARSVAGALERLSLVLLVGGGLFEFATGILNIEDYYPWHFGFIYAHYYGAWVFVSALALHVVVKLPTMATAFRTRGALAPLREDLAHTRPEPPQPGGLAPIAPAEPTLSRRGLLAMVGGASLALFLANIGETIGGPLRRLALLAPRGRVFGTGPTDFPVNRTAAFAGITADQIGPGWRLQLHGPVRALSLGRAQLAAMPQYTYELTLACVEGWTTTQHWSGVRLSDLRRLVGAPESAVLTVESLEQSGTFRQATLAAGQIANDRSLLALGVNGVPLSLDHGAPARVIVPALPGVHNTKWVGSMTFISA